MQIMTIIEVINRINDNSKNLNNIVLSNAGKLMRARCKNNEEDGCEIMITCSCAWALIATAAFADSTNDKDANSGSNMSSANIGNKKIVFLIVRSIKFAVLSDSNAAVTNDKVMTSIKINE